MPNALSALLLSALLAAPAAAQDAMPGATPAPAVAGEAGAADAGASGRIAVAKAVGFPPPEYSENLIAAYRRAIDTRLPMVVVFAASWSGYSNRLVSEVLLAPAFRERFEGRGIFVSADPDKEDGGGNVGKLIKELGIERYPVIAVLDPRSTAIRERGRVEGYFPVADMTARLARVLAMPPAAASLTAR